MGRREQLFNYQLVNARTITGLPCKSLISRADCSKNGPFVDSPVLPNQNGTSVGASTALLVWKSTPLSSILL